MKIKDAVFSPSSVTPYPRISERKWNSNDELVLGIIPFWFFDHPALVNPSLSGLLYHTESTLVLSPGEMSFLYS